MTTYLDRLIRQTGLSPVEPGAKTPDLTVPVDAADQSVAETAPDIIDLDETVAPATRPSAGADAPRPGDIGSPSAFEPEPPGAAPHPRIAEEDRPTVRLHADGDATRDRAATETPTSGPTDPSSPSLSAASTSEVPSAASAAPVETETSSDPDQLLRRVVAWAAAAPVPATDAAGVDAARPNPETPAEHRLGAARHPSRTPPVPPRPRSAPPAAPPPIPAPGSVALASPQPASLSDPTPLEATGVREEATTIAIGALSVTVEGPEAPRQAPALPAPSPQAAPPAVPDSGRLARRYLRL